MRIRTILAAAAAPAALAAVLLGTTAASASTTTTTTTPQPHGSFVCTSTNPYSPQVISGTLNSNLDVPAGTYCSVQWGEVTGNVSVEGALSASAATFDRNVAVSGPGSELSLANFPSHIKGNLSVTGSSGDWSGVGMYMYGKSFGDNASLGSATSQVDGNVTFDYNTGGLAIINALNVGGSFEASNNGPYPNGLGIVNNPGWFYTGGLTTVGSQSIS
jgi:hypothetical protein